MTRARRTLGGLLLAALALSLLSTAPARGQTPDGPWAGSRITSPSTTTNPSPQITAEFFLAYSNTSTNRVRATTEVTAPAGLPAGCVTTLGGTGDHGVLTREEGGHRHPTSATLTTTCNGTYQVRVTATHQGFGCSLSGCRWSDTQLQHVLTGTLAVSAPAPSPTATTATAADRRVTVAWTPVADAPPDFLGYRIERVSASGTTATIAEIDDRTASSFTDASPPAEGGTTTYRVFGRRAGPAGEIQSSAAAASTDVAAAPVEPGEPGEPGGPGQPGDDAAAPAPGTTPGVTTPGGRNPSITGGPGSSVRVPRLGTPSRTFFPPLLTPQVVGEDAGFDDRLPYDDIEPGGAEPILPDDELASSSFDDVAGRGLVVPLATALVLAVWAFHLRFLARAARPDEGVYEYGYE